MAGSDYIPMSKIIAPKPLGITREELQSRMPKGSSAKITDEIIALLNSMEDDTGLDQGLLEEQFLSNLHLIENTTFKKLIAAVKFVNLKRFMENKDAYSIVFREKYNRLIAEGRDVNNYVSMYNRSPLIVEIEKKTILPAHLEYSKTRHNMIMRLESLANGVCANGGKVSPMVQATAASKLLDQLAIPAEHTVNLNFGLTDKAVSVQERLIEQLNTMTEKQYNELISGADLNDVQQLGINVIDTETV